MNPLPSPDPLRAVVLCRVSSSEQADHGYGLDSQAAACRAFARAEGLEIVATFAEDARSTVPLDERKGGREALDAMLRLGAGVLLLARRDRLARDPYIAGHAKRAVAIFGARIFYADGGNGEDDSALLLDDIQHAISAHERRAIVARLRSGREEKTRQYASRGERAYVGGRPAFGYRANAATHELEIDPDAAEVVRLIFEQARRGRSVRAIASDLNARQAGGRSWHATSVRRVLTHDGYASTRGPGVIVHGRVVKAARAALAARRKVKA